MILEWTLYVCDAVVGRVGGSEEQRLAGRGRGEVGRTRRKAQERLVDRAKLSGGERQEEKLVYWRSCPLVGTPTARLPRVTSCFFVHAQEKQR